MSPARLGSDYRIREYADRAGSTSLYSSSTQTTSPPSGSTPSGASAPTAHPCYGYTTRSGPTGSILSPRASTSPARSLRCRRGRRCWPSRGTLVPSLCRYQKGRRRMTDMGRARGLRSGIRSMERGWSELRPQGKRHRVISRHRSSAIMKTSWPAFLPVIARGAETGLLCSPDPVPPRAAPRKEDIRY